MKTLRLISVIIAILITVQLSAQEKGTEELKMGYGIITSTQLMYDIGEIFSTAFTLGGITYKDEKSLGSLYINYNYSVGDRFTIGGLIGYESIKNNVYSYSTPIGKNTCGYYTFAFETAFHYVRNEKFQLYSGLGLAYTYGTMKFDSNTSQESSSTTNVSLPNFNLTGIGMRFGGSFGGFIEFGFGYRGVVNAGLSFQM